MAEFGDDDSSILTPAALLTGEQRGGRARHVIAVGGGRAGVGKSLLSANLAVYLAQLGRNVVLCDADPSGANLHTMLGSPRPALRVEGPNDEVLELMPTSVPGLSLLPSAYDAWAVAPKRTTRERHWTRQLENVVADYVVFNLGASLAPAT
ncbi:MAG: tyrosine-protein kinase family protein, partial [Myxococcales bacterium]|nr:tyrosine-protein kinase family protein [Myxococcales bacterium]